MKSCVLLLALAAIAKCSDISGLKQFFKGLSAKTCKDASITESILKDNNQVAFPENVAGPEMMLCMISLESANILEKLDLTKPFRELSPDEIASTKSSIAEAISKFHSLKKTSTKILKESELASAPGYEKLIGKMNYVRKILKAMQARLAKPVEKKSKDQDQDQDQGQDQDQDQGQGQLVKQNMDAEQGAIKQLDAGGKNSQNSGTGTKLSGSSVEKGASSADGSTQGKESSSGGCSWCAWYMFIVYTILLLIVSFAVFYLKRRKSAGLL